jgi:hypothetical protein
MWGEMWLHYFGRWDIQDNILVLYKGRDITEDLIVEEIEDINSDTLIIYIKNELTEVLPRIRFSIGADTSDLKINNGRIEILKRKYWDFTHPSISGHDYQYAPVTLNLRTGNIYATLQYIFANKEISISLSKDFSSKTMADSVLCKYKIKDGILFSFDETHEIERNDLKKEIN